jgi:hypothetical protein
VTGPQSLSQYKRVSTIGRVIGRSVFASFEEMSSDEACREWLPLLPASKSAGRCSADSNRPMAKRAAEGPWAYGQADAALHASVVQKNRSLVDLTLPREAMKGRNPQPRFQIWIHATLEQQLRQLASFGDNRNAFGKVWLISQYQFDDRLMSVLCCSRKRLRIVSQRRIRRQDRGRGFQITVTVHSDRLR